MFPAESTTETLLRDGIVPSGEFAVRVDFVEYDLEFDIPRVPDGHEDPASAWEQLAVADQARVDALDRQLRAADAARTAALLTSYESSMEDLRHRFGEQCAQRNSPGAQTFFKSTGLRWRMAPMRIAHLVDTASTLRSRLPLTWAAYLDGDATWQAVDLAVAQAEGLEPDRWAAYDEVAAGLVVTAAASRMKKRLRHARERLQDDTAPQRAERTVERRTARLEGENDSGASFVVTGPAIPLVGFDAALTKAAIAAAGIEGETRTVSQLRHDIVIDLLVEGIKHAADPSTSGIAVSTRKGVTPTVILTIPALAALGRSDEQALLAGCGPIDLETAKRVAGTATSFTRVLTDPITGVRLDMDRRMRVPPADMRRWVVIRDELCRFPGCTRPAHLCDLDHIAEWRDHGVTDFDNLVALHRGDHIAKTMKLWQQELDSAGHVDWTDPWRHRFQDPPPPGPDPAPTALVEWASGPDPVLDDCPF